MLAGLGGHIAAGAAFLLQVTGGFTVGVVAAQAANPGLDPALVSAYGAIGALFGLVTWLAKGRIERCEKREDTMLTADSEKTATMRELAAAVNKAADVTANAVSAATGAVEESKRNGGKLDALTSGMGELRREVERLCQTSEGRGR